MYLIHERRAYWNEVISEIISQSKLGNMEACFLCGTGLEEIIEENIKLFTQILDFLIYYIDKNNEEYICISWKHIRENNALIYDNTQIINAQIAYLNAASAINRKRLFKKLSHLPKKGAFLEMESYEPLYYSCLENMMLITIMGFKVSKQKDTVVISN